MAVQLNHWNNTETSSIELLKWEPVGEGAAYIQKWCHSGSWHLTGQYYPDADADADDADADADAGDVWDDGSSSNEWLLVTMQTAGNFQEKWDFPPSGILKQEVLDPAPLYLKIL